MRGVLVSHDCSLYHGLVSYRDLILRCNKSFYWTAVYAYDRRFRAELAARKSMDFSKIIEDLYKSIFTSSAIRHGLMRCHRCQSVDHPVRLCPYPRNSTHSRRRKRQCRDAVSASSCSQVDFHKSELPNAIARSELAPSLL